MKYISTYFAGQDIDGTKKHSDRTLVLAPQIPPLDATGDKTGRMATQSPDTRPPTLPKDTYSIQDAAALVDRSTKTVVRWCRDSTFQKATKVKGPKGDEWSIPADDLAQVIADKGLTVNLTDDVPTESAHESGQTEALLDAMNTVANLRGEVGQLTGQNEQLTRQNDRLGSDNDHLRGEYERTQADLVESERARGQLEGQLEQAQANAKEATEKRDSLDLEHRELQKTSAESLSAVSADLCLLYTSDAADE